MRMSLVLGLLNRSRYLQHVYRQHSVFNSVRHMSGRPLFGADKIVHSPYNDVVIPEEPLWPLLERRMAQHKDNTAFICGASGLHVTHGEVRDMIPRVGAALHELGVRQGDVFCIFSVNIPHYMVLFVALHALGVVPTLVSPAANADELERQIRMSGAKYIATVEPLAEVARTACDRVGIEKRWVFGSEIAGFRSFSSLLDGSSSSLPEVTINPREDLCALPYSSGTTGLPKGVMLTHHNVVSNLFQITHPDVLRLSPDDVIIGVLPFFHIYGLVVIGLNTLFTGSACVTMPKFEPEPFLKNIQDHKATLLYNVPPIILFMAKHPMVKDYNVSSVKTVVSGAAPLSSDLSEEFQQSTGVTCIRNAYGLTETSPVTHVNPKDGWRHGSVGYLVPNTRAKIVDIDTGETLGPDQDGELWMQGPQVMKGYLNNKEATDATITPDGWLKSGDIAHYSEDGFFFVVDRLKELIKYKGFQVPPAELEGILLKHPSVADAAVIGVPDDEAGELPRAYLQLKPGQSASEEDIESFVSENVAAYKRLRGGVVFVDAIPKTASGKILRKDLKALL